MRPLSAVLACIDDGALTVAEVAGRTGLSRDTVESALEQLRRMGVLDAQAVPAGCPPAGCGSCAVSCGTGPVLVGLTRR